MFRAIFKIFNDKLDPKIKRDTYFSSGPIKLTKVKLIKQDMSFAFHLLRKQSREGSYPYFSVNFSYNNLVIVFSLNQMIEKQILIKSMNFYRQLNLKFLKKSFSEVWYENLLLSKFNNKTK